MKTPLRLTLTLPGLALLLALCGPATAQRYGGYNRNNNPNNNNNVTGFNGDQPKNTTEQVMRFEGQMNGTAGGHRHVVLALVPVMGGAPMRVLVPNKENSDEPKPEFIEKLKSLQPDSSIVRVEVEKMYGLPQLKTLYPVEVKPGEANPNAFVFAERFDDPATRAPMIALTKYGERLEVGIVPAKDEKGKLAPDPRVTGELEKVKEGEVVYATLALGRTPLLTAIYPYKDPQSGKLSKMTEQEVSGQKAPAVEIETADGKTLTALVPGKLVNSKKWVADPMVLREVRAIRPKTDVQFVTHDEDGQTVLTQITKAPPAPKTASASGNRDMRDEKPGK